MATNTTTIKFTGQFDSSGITKGLQEIKKQITSSNISEELKKQLQDSFNKVEVNLPKLDKFMKKEDFNLKELTEYQKLVQEITKDMTNFSKVANEADFTKNFSEQDTARLKKFDEQIKQIDEKLKTTKEEIIKTFSNSDKGKIGGKSNNTLNGFIEQLISVPPDKIEEKLNEVIKDAETQADQAIDRLQTIFKNKATGHQGGKGFIELLFGENSGVSLKQGKTLGDPKAGGKGAYSVFNDIREQVLKLEKDAGPDKINPILEAYSKFIEEFFNVPKDKQSVLSGLVTPEIVERLREFKGPEGIEGLKQALGKGNLKFLADGEAEKLRLTKEQAVELKMVVDSLAEKGEITRDQANNLITKLTGLSGAINDNADAAKNLDNQHKALEATFGGLAHRITSSISALTVFNKSIQVIHKAIASVKELDAAFTQIAIVSEQTNEQAWQMFDSFNKLAKQYSITTKDLTEGAKLFYQQGLNAADTMKMVEASTISAALGEVTMTEAANTLTAAIQGYNESASVAMDYTDKIAMVGAVSAADFNELSAAMEKTASSAYTAGIDFDHLLGYLGKMIEVTREAPANLGTAMKTIIARFEDMKKDPAALIDGASANKVEAALATIGIALRDATGEFRPLQDVFDELGMKWNSLTRNQQAYIATVAAGSRQQSRFLAMMNNYDRTLDLITESQNSAGAALEQYSTYQDSAAAATARLTAAWEKFYSKVASPERITNTINLLTNLVEVMNKIGPVWTTVIATIGAHSINKIIKGNLISNIIDFFGDEVKNSAKEKLTLTLGSVFKNGISFGIKNAFHKFDNSDLDEYTNALIKAGQIGTKKGILKGVGAAGIEIGASLGPVLIGVLVAALTTAAAIGIAKAITFAEEKEQRWLKQDSEKIKKDREKVDEYKKERRAIEDNYEIYKKYNKQIVLTEDELKEQNEAVENIQNQYKNLIVVTDELGRKNILNTEQLEKHTKELKDQTLELEKHNALAKYNATNPSPAQKRKYGDSDEYMKDWTVTQLTNVGYTEEEAKILDKYGERLRNPNNKSGFIFNNTPGSYSLYDQIFGEYFKAGGKENEYIEILSESFIDTLKNGNIEEISNMLHTIDLSYKYTTEDIKKFYDIIKNYGEEYIKALEILQNNSKEYAKTLLNLNLNSIDDSSLRNDLSNLFNNLNNYNNGLFLEQFNQENLELGQTIEDAVQKVNDSIEEYITNLNPADQHSFHELTEKLLDPSLSPNKKRELVEKFRIDAEGISDEVDKILTQYVEGTNFDIKRREKLNQVLGITDPKFLRQFNSSQLRIIDQFRAANKTDFDLGAYIQTDVGKKMLKMLGTLENDITKDPTIYRQAQDIMVDFFKINFGLDNKEAFNMFQEMFGNFPELAMEAAENNFSNAKNLILTEPTKALSKKQTEAYQELERILGDSLRDYISINEQGEEYLTVAGKIAVFEKTALDYRNSIIAESDNYISQIEQIFAVTEKNKEGEALLTKEQKKQIKNLEQEIELNSKRLEQLDKIKEYTTQVTAETANISMAKGYSDNLKIFKQAEDEMKKFNGVMNNDTAAAIMAMDASYAQYLNKRLVGEDYYYTISEEGMKALRAEERKNYNLWIEEQKGKLQERIDELESELKYFSEIASAEYEINEDFNEDDFNNKIGLLDDKLTAAETEIEGEIKYEEDKNKEILTGASNTAQQFQNMWSAAYTNLRSEWNELARAMEDGKPTESPDHSHLLQIPKPSNTGMNTDITSAEKPSENNSNNTSKEETKEQRVKRRAQEQVDRLNEVLERLRAARDNLVPLGPELEDVSKSGAKTADETKKLTKALKDLADALEDLDDLLKDVNRDLKDINVDYNPFTDLFEAWEHEWDYYYNIKRLIQQIEDQGKYIDGIISADYTTADQKIAAEQAKVGNLLAAMAANDAYIESLRTGMSQTALELMDEFGEYYKINPDTGQLYQHDTSLNQINNTINQRRQEIYELQKLQNEKENDLSLEQAKLDALEQERSAYESILSTVESQIDSLKNDDDIIANVSELESEQANIKAKITLTDESIDTVKDVVRNMEDEIQEIEVEITLKDQNLSKLEEYVDKMEDKVSEYEEYWENLNSTIAEQQELLQSITEEYQKYVDTAISTEQDLYNAIIENYQDEINQKKKQYDELKSLDKDYLESVKNNINEERQAREDSNKQKSYQQSLQRAQLLQQDTSGAYRSELAQLNKDIEQQRQDLYDDLVDKQVEALEKEIEKRHELYDKEVAALEERLAYMQENAILLWEMVNNIVAEGSENMMATLENTTAYINSNELAKEKQRKTWEYNVKKTFDGVQNKTIDMLNDLIEAGNEYIKDKLPEVGTAVDEYTQTYEDAAHVIVSYNELLQNNMWSLFGGTGNEGAFQTILNSFMTTWNNTTNTLTGYSESWQAIVEGLRSATEGNIEALRNMNNEGGSIKELDKALRDSAKELYEDFLDERRRYRNELEGLVNTIRTEITAAIQSAADAIRNAANSLQINPNKDNGGTSGSTVSNGSSSTASSGGGGGTAGYKGWTAWFRIANYYGDGKDYVYQDRANFSNATYETLYNSWNNQLESMRKKYPGSTSWQFTPFATGGFADFTGPAWLDGTKSQPEAVLNPKQTRLFTSMVNSLEKASNNSNINSPLGSSYNIGDINTTIQVDKLDNQTDINKLARQVEDKIVKDIRNRIPVSVTKGV